MTGGTIASALVDALKQLLRTLFTPIEGLIETHGNTLLQVIVGTPHPETALQTPHTLPWVTLYDYYWSTIVPLSLLLFGLAVGLVILLETTSHLFSGYHRANLKRRAFSGLLGILSWWWLAAFSLQVTDQLVTLLLPDLSTVSLFQSLSFSSIGLLGVLASLSIDAVLFGLLALLYLGRRLVLYGFVLGMPLLIVSWIPGVGPFSLIARFAKRLAGFYVPFLLMPVPVAVLLRLGGLLGDAATLSMGGLGAWLTALVIPFVAVVSPLLLVWQAGALVLLVDRMGRRASRARLRARVQRGQELTATLQRRSHTGLRELGRRTPTLRDQRADATDGQGRRLRGRLRSAPSRLGRRFRADESDTSSGHHATPIQFEEPDHEGTGRHEPAAFDTADHDQHARTDSTDDRTDR